MVGAIVVQSDGAELRHLGAIGAEAQCTRDSVIHLHSIDESEHVPAFHRGDWGLLLAEHVGDLLQRQDELTSVHELGDQIQVPHRHTVIQGDQQASGPTADSNVAESMRVMRVRMPDAGTR